METEKSAMDGNAKPESKPNARPKRRKWIVRSVLLICLVATGYGIAQFASGMQRRWDQQRQQHQNAFLQHQVNLQQKQFSDGFRPGNMDFNPQPNFQVMQSPQASIVDPRTLTTTPVNQLATNATNSQPTKASPGMVYTSPQGTLPPSQAGSPPINPVYSNANQLYPNSNPSTSGSYGYSNPAFSAPAANNGLAPSLPPSLPSPNSYPSSVIPSYMPQGVPTSTTQAIQFVPHIVDGKMVYRPVVTEQAVSTHPLSADELAANSEVMKLLAQLRGAYDEQKLSLQASLREAVAKQFELKHAGQTKRIEKLEKELADSKALLQKRTDRKDEIIDRRMAELLNTPDELAWDSVARNTPQSTASNQWTQWTNPQYPNAQASNGPRTYVPNNLPQPASGVGVLPSSLPSGTLPYGTLPTESTSLANPTITETSPANIAEVDTVGDFAGTESTLGRSYTNALDLKLIESGYAYLEALAELKTIVVNEQTKEMRASAQRKVDRAQAIWEGAINSLELDLKKSQATIARAEEELVHLQEHVDAGDITANELRKAKATSKIYFIQQEAIQNQLTWVEDFKTKKLQPILGTLAEPKQEQITREVSADTNASGSAYYGEEADTNNRSSNSSDN